MSINCFAPGCREDHVTVARDEMFGVLVAFCSEHREEWTSKDHIRELSDDGD